MDALIVASTVKQQHALCDVVYSEKLDCVVCSTAVEARRASLVRPFDLFVVNGGLTDEQGNRLAQDLAENCDCGGVYMDEYSRCDMFSDDLGELGIITLVRPVTKAALTDAIRLIVVAHARVRRLRAENDELSAKIEDIKYISRAKIVLMRSLGYTEEQAHRTIERQAMERGLSKRRLAIEILKTYEAT